MLKFFITWQLFRALPTFLVGISLLMILRRKNRDKIKTNQPAGFWIRATCLGTDIAVIEVVTSLLAYHGNLFVAGQITLLITFAYFFFFWFFFSATPMQMLTGIKILSQDGKSPKIWQLLVRLGMLVFLVVGWITIFIDRKEKRMLHDLVTRTHVVYGKNEFSAVDHREKKGSVILLGLVVIILLGLIVSGLGEKLSRYSENNQITFFDFNKDGLTDALSIDVDEDGKSDVFKYDLNNDEVIEFTTFDADKDGVAESIDLNNDSRIDGYDFDKDNRVEIPVVHGQFFIWLWRVLFGTWIAGFTILLVFTMMKENNRSSHKT